MMVPGAGLEPARHFCREILSLLCLPIPPPGLKRGYLYTAVSVCVHHELNMEARVGIEPALTELQSAA